MVFILLIILAAIALGIIGVVVHALFYLLIIGIVIFIADLILLGTRMRRPRRPVR